MTAIKMPEQAVNVLVNASRAGTVEACVALLSAEHFARNVDRYASIHLYNCTFNAFWERQGL